MNRRPQGLSISKAIPGFIQYKAAEVLSPTTLRSYSDDMKKWLGFTGDKEVTNVITEDLRTFFVWLRTEYKPAQGAVLVANNYQMACGECDADITV